MCRSDIPVEFLDHPQLLYKIEDNAATTDDGYQWFYEGRNGKNSFAYRRHTKKSQSGSPHIPYIPILNVFGHTPREHRHTPGLIGGWWKYDSRSSAELEEAQRSGLASAELTLCGTLYTVSLVDMVQFNKDNPSRKRQIKREHVAISRAKGVAGLLNHPQKYRNVLHQ